MSDVFSAAETRILRFLRQGGCDIQDSVRETHVLLVGEPFFSDIETVPFARAA